MTTLEIFKEICKIPHCSHRSDKLKTYLQNFAEDLGYRVETDKSGNILCTHKSSNLTLQSHYDMVCIGEYESLELFEEVVEGKKWLRAKNSTLGADNGIGISLTLKMMLDLKAEGKSVDALFTANEEVGLLGARDLDLKVKTKYLLNIDSEEEAIVTLGCAGGVDVKVELPIERVKKIGNVKEIEKSGYRGGHSGVDIHLNIENAIQELAKEVQSDIISIEGGERRNSIAKRAIAKVYTSEGSEEVEVIENTQKIVSALKEFQHGVREFNTTLDIVESSVNLAIVKSHGEKVEIHLSLRSMDDQKLQELLKDVESFFVERFSKAKVISEGYYAPWKPEENEFTDLVVQANKKVFSDVKLGAIHAGLECGILGEKFPDLQMASIGPNIIYPHSTREAVELKSIERVEEVVRELLELI